MKTLKSNSKSLKNPKTPNFTSFPTPHCKNSKPPLSVGDAAYCQHEKITLNEVVCHCNYNYTYYILKFCLISV